MSRHVVGTMVGTSLDGIDGALVAFGPDGGANLQAYATVDFREVDVDRLRAIASGEPTTASELSALGFALAREHARVVEIVDPVRDAELVGAHGVTVAHRPSARPGHGWQLLSGGALAALSRRDVVCDFRAADIALGGEGAPLAPLVDLRLRAGADEDRVILNLGGISNYTAIGAGATEPGQLLAGDAGPANLVLDAWMRRLSGGRSGWDAEGRLALSGRPDPAVVARMLEDPWFARPRPRSGGREEFGEGWLDRFLECTPDGASDADRMATLVEICARAVADQIRGFGASWRRAARLRVLVTGGGRHNRALMQALGRNVPGAVVEPIEAIGENGDAKEAVDFAWLARERHHERPVGIAAVTGATRDVLAGALYRGAERKRA